MQETGVTLLENVKRNFKTSSAVPLGERERFNVANLTTRRFQSRRLLQGYETLITQRTQKLTQKCKCPV